MSFNKVKEGCLYRFAGTNHTYYYYVVKREEARSFPNSNIHVIIIHPKKHGLLSRECTIKGCPCTSTIGKGSLFEIDSVLMA
jgi:hypothetical protein